MRAGWGPHLMHTEFEGKTVAVLGLARSGLACADVLTQLGARVHLYDAKPADQLEEAIAAANALGLTPRVGDVPVDYGELDYLITSPGVRKDAPVLQNAVAAGVPVLGEIEAAYRHRPRADPRHHRHQRQDDHDGAAGRDAEGGGH